MNGFAHGGSKSKVRRTALVIVSKPSLLLPAKDRPVAFHVPGREALQAGTSHEAASSPASVLLPDEEGVHRFQRAYRLTADAATWRRARGWAIWRAVGSLLIAGGRRGRPGGKPTWGPPALASLRCLTASVA